VSLVDVNRRRSYPMVMEQIVRGTPSSNQGVCALAIRFNIYDFYRGDTPVF
jgi:hypothetical protein